MREIKFRGKTLEDAGLRKAGEWAYGGYFVDDCYGGCPEGKHYIVEFNSAGMGYFAHTRVEKESVGQYTGLKDKNGKEIYESDVIEFNNNDYELTAGHRDDDIVIAEVEYSCGAWGLKEADGQLHDLYIVLVNDEEAEIVGNIYEHEQLLKR